MQNLLLIGGGGFIGSNLAYHLESVRGLTCLVADRDSRKLALRYGDRPFAFEKIDIARDKPALDRLIAEADGVINLAAEVLPKRFVESPLQVVQTNLFDTLDTVERCITHRRPLIHFSTCEVYGKSGGSDQAFTEDGTDCILGPIVKQRWIYANVKQLTDRIIHAHGQNGALDYVILRPFNFIGPLMDWLYDDAAGDGQARVVPSFMADLIFDRPIQLVGGGASRRSFTFIGDAVEAIATVLSNVDEMRNQIVNIGNPSNETTIRDLALLMRDLYRDQFGGAWRAELQEVSGQDFYGPGYEDCDRRIPDIAKLSGLGWAPRHGLEETLRQTMAYFIDNKAALTRSAAPVA